MTEFLKKLTDKMLDFFNFGRFITIALPGLLIALAAAMFTSQLLLPSIRPAVIQDPETAGGLQVRGQPETTARILATVKQGDVITVKKEQGAWYQVELQPSKQQGWISADQVIAAPSPAADQSGAKDDKSDQVPFSGQLQEDSGRLWRHPYLGHDLPV